MDDTRRTAPERKLTRGSESGTAPPRKPAKRAARAEQAVFEVRRSKIQGRGVFAIVDIPKGTRIVQYKGQRISTAKADERYFDDEKTGNHHTFLFAIDEDTVIDASRAGNEARFVNHSCAPNCEAVIEDGKIFVDAKKKIPAGTELTYDYWYTTDDAYTDAELRKIYPCRCGTAKCRGTLAATRKLRKSGR